jgi:hypothetical protein
MPAWRSYLRSFFILSLVVVSVAGMVNVFSDNADTVAKAKELGCPHPVCTLTRMERTPFAQTFEFQSTAGTVGVKCVRSSIFFGEYACSKL